MDCIHQSHELAAQNALKRLVRARAENKRLNEYGNRPELAKEQSAAMRECTKLGQRLLDQDRKHGKQLTI